jgi:hypothetical protein
MNHYQADPYRRYVFCINLESRSTANYACLQYQICDFSPKDVRKVTRLEDSQIQKASFSKDLRAKERSRGISRLILKERNGRWPIAILIRLAVEDLSKMRDMNKSWALI